jgi:NAD(P)H-quinone oxidoreductase subunit I
LDIGEYIQSVSNAAKTILEGMAVTFSHLFREPITVQYPDRTDRPVTSMLPDRYRGLLEVQMDICTGCKRCERNCPIDCIAIDLKKDPETKKQMMTRFDIDMGKCMYCGLCVEACLIDSTGAIRHTTEFEGAASTLDALVFRFVPPGTSRVIYKPPKNKEEIPVGVYGPHAREARERAMRDNPEPLEDLRRKWREERRTAAVKKGTGTGKKATSVWIQPSRFEPLGTSVLSIQDDEAKLASLLEDLTPKTDCGECGYKTCKAYAAAMAGGKDFDASKCIPGGVVTTAELTFAMAIRFRGVEVAQKLAAVDMAPAARDVKNAVVPIEATMTPHAPAKAS